MKNLKFKVIGTNSTTKHLEDSIFEFEEFVFTQRNQILSTIFEGSQYLFDIKSVAMCDKGVLISGFISDETNKVGRISFKYLS